MCTASEDNRWPATASNKIAKYTCPDLIVITRSCLANGTWDADTHCAPQKRNEPICNGSIHNCKLPLSQLTFAGTHNSGTYNLYFPNPLPTIPNLLTGTCN